MNELEMLKEILSEFEEQDQANTGQEEASGEIAKGTESQVDNQAPSQVVNSATEQEKPKEEVQEVRTKPQKKDKEVFKKLNEVLEGLEKKVNQVDEIISEKMQPVYQKYAEEKLDKQVNELKQKYSDIFNTQEGEKILNAVYQYALNHYEIEKDSSGKENIVPLSLEKSLLLVLAPQLYSSYKELAEREKRRQELWGTLDTSATEKKRAITTEADLQDAVGEILKKYGF